MNYVKNTVILILLAIILTVIALFFINQKYPKINTVSFVNNKQTQNKQTLTTDTPDTILVPDSKFIIPDSIFLKVPFTPQAPTANWDELHNEACEEASAIMAAEYFASSTEVTLSSKFVEEQMTQLTNWQEKTFGYNLSISSEETAEMIQEVYKLNTEIKKDFTEDDLKKALTENKLILFPANGRKLYNPNYKQPGPIYHMLLIKGYNSNGNFITNDPGTRKGLNYPYTFEILYEANGNYSHATKTVDLEQKNIILVWK